MAEPKLYVLLQRIQADLAAIVADGGTTYHYTPDRVFICTTWDPTVDPRLFNESIGSAGTPAVIYGVRRVDRHIDRKNTGDNVNGDRPKATVDVSVLVSQRFQPSSVEDTPDAAQVIERMLRDVIRKLAFEDPGLGSTIVADDVMAEGGLDDTVIEDAPASWVCGQVTFRVAYDFFSTQP